MLERGVVRHVVQLTDRLRDGQLGLAQEAVFDHGEHQGGGADLEVGRDLGQIGVADDHVQTPVAVGVGVRLVAGVHDRALQRGLETHLDLEEVGPLRDLEAVLAAVLADSHSTGAADDLAGDEERHEVANDHVERRRPRHQVVLVRAVGRALVVGVVLVQVDRGVHPRHRGHPSGRLGHDAFAGLVPADRVEGVRDLGRGVLGVGVVDVEPGAVGQDDIGHAGVFLGFDELLRNRSARAAELEAPRIPKG